MKLKVKVSKKNIRNGIPGCAYSCAIACALTEMGWENVHITPEESMASIWKNGERTVLQLSRRARRFANDFDQERPVKPSEFVLHD